jgi:hypothetical protein
MHDEPPPEDGDPAEAALPPSVTGTAAGALGTGTALDDTQIYGTDAFVAEPAMDPVPVAEAGAPARLESAPVATAQVARTPARLVAEPPDPAASPRRPRGNPLVGIAAVVGAAALVVLAAGSLLTNGGGIDRGAGQSPLPTDLGAASQQPPSASPDAGPPGKGNGKGNKDKPTHKP